MLHRASDETGEEKKKTIQKSRAILPTLQGHFARQYSEFLPFCLSSSPWETSDGRNERYPILDPKKAIRLVRAIIKNNSRSLEKSSWFRPDGLDVYVRYNTK